jgi:hypothetical protein
MNDKFYEMALADAAEKMTITTLSDAINEGGLPTWDAMLAAYKSGDQCEAGKALFVMIDDYMAELAEEAAPELEQRDKIDRAMDEGERRADYQREEQEWAA